MIRFAVVIAVGLLALTGCTGGFGVSGTGTVRAVAAVSAS